MEGSGMGALFASVLTSMMCLVYIVPMIIMLGSIALWIYVLIDVLQRAESDFPNARGGRPDPNERLLWVLIVVLTGTIGSIVYYFIVMRPYPRPPHQG